MVGPQNDLQTEMYSLLNSLLKNCTNSWVSASIFGKSVCPPSQGRTMVSLWFFIVAGYSIEFPNPVPGPRTPLILFGLGWTSLIGTKFSSGTSKIPYEAAQKSLMNLKCGIFRLVPSYAPDKVFHLSTLARETVLSKMGPAIPILATSGQCSTPARNFSMADWKTSQSATARVSFLRVARGVFLVVSTLTSYRRMLVPPTSPSNAYLSTSDISIKYLFINQRHNQRSQLGRSGNQRKGNAKQFIEILLIFVRDYRDHISQQYFSFDEKQPDKE